jgi:hypothetical protein
MIRVLVLSFVLALAASFALADQVVVERTFRTSSDAPFGGSIHVVQRIDGARVREEATTMMNPLPDSAGNRGPAKEMEFATSVWFPDERVWRSWSKEPASLDEIRGTELDSTLATVADQSTGFEEFLGGVPESIQQEVEVAIDSTGEAKAIAGVPARPYRVRAIARFHDLERNLGDSLRFTREVWVAPAIPGTGATLRKTPALMMERVLGMFQFLAIPLFKDATRRLEREVDRLPGAILRDELRLEGARPPSGADPDSAKAFVAWTSEVERIGTEKSRPELFRVPPGVHKPKPSTPRVEVSRTRR